MLEGLGTLGFDKLVGFGELEGEERVGFEGLLVITGFEGLLVIAGF